MSSSQEPLQCLFKRFEQIYFFLKEQINLLVVGFRLWDAQCRWLIAGGLVGASGSGVSLGNGVSRGAIAVGVSGDEGIIAVGSEKDSGISISRPLTETLWDSLPYTLNLI